MKIENRQTIKEQFNSFCKRNNPKNFEIAVDYFCVFGGLDISLDMKQPLEKLIEKHILKEYKFFRKRRGSQVSLSL